MSSIRQRFDCPHQREFTGIIADTYVHCHYCRRSRTMHTPVNSLLGWSGWGEWTWKWSTSAGRSTPTDDHILTIFTRTSVKSHVYRCSLRQPGRLVSKSLICYRVSTRANAQRKGWCRGNGNIEHGSSRLSTSSSYMVTRR